MHQSASFVRTPLKHSGDEACDFCEAIVRHWRDVLTSNTTEKEFKQVSIRKWQICQYAGLKYISVSLQFTCT